MSDTVLEGIGVLVTRPRHQANELALAIEAAGGNAIRFPVIDIKSIDTKVVSTRRAALPDPDIVIFVSRNAVAHGIDQVGSAQIAAIGPATAAAIEATGRQVDIASQCGFTSESLLEVPDLQDVRGKVVLIVRGRGGRELLGDTLRERGAEVHYLATYERATASPGNQALSQLESAWLAGRINAVTVMSVDSLDKLVDLLPQGCTRMLDNALLVTPAERVLKEALKRFPASRPVLASGPGADAMVRAIATAVHTGQTS